MHTLATLLAGLSPASTSDRFAALRRSDIWQAHARTLDQLFRSLAARHANPFARWARIHAAPLHAARTVFYPFSGPDILFSNT